jgi:hypothetical protein
MVMVGTGIVVPNIVGGPDKYIFCQLLLEQFSGYFVDYGHHVGCKFNTENPKDYMWV